MLVGIREGRNQYYTLGMQSGQVWRGIPTKNEICFETCQRILALNAMETFQR